MYDGKRFDYDTFKETAKQHNLDIDPNTIFMSGKPRCTACLLGVSAIGEAGTTDIFDSTNWNDGPVAYRILEKAGFDHDYLIGAEQGFSSISYYLLDNYDDGVPPEAYLAGVEDGERIRIQLSNEEEA